MKTAGKVVTTTAIVGLAFNSTFMVLAANNDTSSLIEANTKKNTQDISDAIPNQADYMFTYVDNQIYKIYTSPEKITDIQLQPEEQILSILAGDTSRWQVDRDVSKTATGQTQWHVFVKPLREGITTNFVITSTKHVYHMEMKVGSSYNPVICWRYPLEEKMALQQAQQAKENANEEITGNFNLEQMNYKYKISGKKYRWKPLMVFDDGSHTYIQMPETMKSSEAPALFIRDGRKLQLVNYRVRNSYYIVDRLFQTAELRCGKDSILIIKVESNKQRGRFQ